MNAHLSPTAIFTSAIYRCSISLLHVLRRPHRSLGAIGCASLPQDGFDMGLDGGFRNVQFAGDDLVGLSLHQAFQDFRSPVPRACRPSVQTASTLLLWCPEPADDRLRGVRSMIERRTPTGQNTLTEHHQFKRLEENFRGTGC